jgi:hypothetical protein
VSCVLRRVPDSLVRYLDVTIPRVLQFSCHGGLRLRAGQPAIVSTQGDVLGGDLLFADNKGTLSPLHADMLARVLIDSPAPKDRLECIFLNGCNTHIMAAELLRNPDIKRLFPRLCIIGWSTTVMNSAAIECVPTLKDVLIP